jgi:hypothetical protein
VRDRCTAPNAAAPVLKSFFDRGVVTVGANGTMSMLSELIGPHLEHTATPTADGYLVHFHEPGEDFFVDLRYKRVTP